VTTGMTSTAGTACCRTDPRAAAAAPVWWSAPGSRGRAGRIRRCTRWPPPRAPVAMAAGLLTRRRSGREADHGRPRAGGGTGRRADDRSGRRPGGGGPPWCPARRCPGPRGGQAGEPAGGQPRRGGGARDHPDRRCAARGSQRDRRRDRRIRGGLRRRPTGRLGRSGDGGRRRGRGRRARVDRGPVLPCGRRRHRRAAGARLEIQGHPVGGRAGAAVQR